MKRRINILDKCPAIFLALATGAGFNLSAAPPKQDNPYNSKSTFILPSSPREGRDPFFPDSDYPYQEVQAATHANAPSVTDLVIGTILTTPDGRVFAIINNHTFAPGDEGDVLSKDGTRRIHIHCLAINPRNNTVTVESGGLTVVLSFAGVQ